MTKRAAKLESPAAAERFGDRLHRLLRVAGMSQAELADAIDVNRSSISRLIASERGLTRGMAAMLVAALNLDLAALVTGTDAAHLLRVREDPAELAAAREILRLRAALAEEQAAHARTKDALAEVRAGLASVGELRRRLAAMVPELRALALIGASLASPDSASRGAAP